MKVIVLRNLDSEEKHIRIWCHENDTLEDYATRLSKTYSNYYKVQYRVMLVCSERVFEAIGKRYKRMTLNDGYPHCVCDLESRTDRELYFIGAQWDKDRSFIGALQYGHFFILRNVPRDHLPRDRAESIVYARPLHCLLRQVIDMCSLCTKKWLCKDVRLKIAKMIYSMKNEWLP